MMLELRSFPYIENASGTLFYGGSQKWYLKRWRRIAGCAAVSGANIAACLNIGIAPERVTKSGNRIFSQSSYLDLMNRMITYMRPGFRGFPNRDKYEQTFLRFAEDSGVTLTAEHLKGWNSTALPKAFVRKHLAENKPLALLILTHKDKAFDDETWHWMTITGYETETDEILISNYGRRQTMNAERLFAANAGNDVRLTAFST